MASIAAALQIIHIVKRTAENVCVNKAQCKRLAERFGEVGKALEGLEGKQYDDTVLEPIVAVLEKGKSLVESYEDERNAIKNVLYRAENYAAFREVHEEIDSLGTYLDLDHADIKGELKTSQSEKNMLLDSDAKIDREEMLPNVQRAIPKRSGSSVERGEDDVKNMEKEIIDKCFNAESDAEDLSYLNIPFESEIKLKGAIKELKPFDQRKSKGDKDLVNKALVEKGTWNGIDCAVKVFKSNESHWNREELRKEIASLVKLRHPHVTQLIGRSEHNGRTYVLYEMMDSDLRVLIESRKKKNALSNLLQDNRPFSRAREVSIITQIARGMFYLHEKGLVHGELKCTNLLVKQLGKHIDVKVADFHCSRQLGEEPTTKYKPAHRERWMPPEDFQYLPVDHDLKHPSDELLMKGDVYSFAMTCYEVVTGKYPFDGVPAEEIEEKVKRGIRPDLPEALSEDLKNLIAKCWHQDPEQRPRFQGICYVLNVEAVHLMSQAEKLWSCFGFVHHEEPVGDVLAGKRWDDIFSEVNALKAVSSQRIDDAAQSLPHYMKIKPADLKPARLLGSGASAEVYEAKWIGCRFAVKWLKVDHVDKLQHEVSIMMKLLHPHVVRLVGFSVLFNRCAIVMEMLDMSLRDLMDTNRIKDPKHHIPFTEPEALGIITKLAQGMDFLHSKHVIHGDLKCANVLVRSANSKGSKLDVKIVDFGLSQFLGSPSSRAPTVGWWRAPEVIADEKSKEHVVIDYKAADVYSFAMTCYEVITGKMPFHDVNYYDVARDLAMAGGGPKLDNVRMRPKLRNLLTECWSLNPNKRPNFAQISKRLVEMAA